LSCQAMEKDLETDEMSLDERAKTPTTLVERSLGRVERFIVIALLAMMVLVVFLGTVELAVVIAEEMLNPPRFILLDVKELLTIFGFFLMILIGLELIETIKTYLIEDALRVEVLFLVGIIAIIRKIIILDVKSLDPLILIGIAAVIVALSVGYWVLKKVLDQRNKKSEPRDLGFR